MVKCQTSEKASASEQASDGEPLYNMSIAREDRLGSELVVAMSNTWVFFGVRNSAGSLALGEWAHSPSAKRMDGRGSVVSFVARAETSDNRSEKTVRIWRRR